MTVWTTEVLGNHTGPVAKGAKALLFRIPERACASRISKSLRINALRSVAVVCSTNRTNLGCFQQTRVPGRGGAEEHLAGEGLRLA